MKKIGKKARNRKKSRAAIRPVSRRARYQLTGRRRVPAAVLLATACVVIRGPRKIADFVGWSSFLPPVQEAEEEHHRDQQEREEHQGVGGPVREIAALDAGVV